MKTSILDAYLLGNKIAVKTAIKLSVSVWGALFISLLMDLEHPVWAMITGMISFFAPDHAQVLKKCVYQCFSTLLGGVIGLIVMGAAAQSPLLAAIFGSIIVFLVSSLSFNTRDANFTFCCSIFTVTVCIMIMVPATMGPESSFIIDTFIDRVGAILTGIVWVSFVSASLWPSFTTDQLKKSGSNLFSSTLLAFINGKTPSPSQRDALSAVYSGVIQASDLADHCDFEGMWGKRGARTIREMNKTALQIVTTIYTLQQQPVHRYREAESKLEALSDIISDLNGKAARLKRDDLAPLTQFVTSNPMPDEQLDVLPMAQQLILLNINQLARDLLDFSGLFISLQNEEKVNVKGIRVQKHPQITNCIRTGLRSMTLFCSAFILWYATGWEYGFLIAVVPIVYSLALAKAPHPNVVAMNVLKGTLLAIPFGLVVNSLLGQASSAIELLILTAGIVLFFGFMGLSSMMTFAYSLGFCVSFMVFLLPEKNVVIDMVFPLERCLSLALGTLILSLLFTLIPRRRMLAEPHNPASLYARDLAKYFLTDDYDRLSQHQLTQRIAVLIDKLIDVAMHEAPEKKNELIHFAAQGIFLMRQLHHIYISLNNYGIDIRRKTILAAWRYEIYNNFVKNQSNSEHTLSADMPTLAKDDSALPVELYHSTLPAYLQEMERITRNVFTASAPKYN